ncbi:retinol-binding protein 3 [Stegostoma tigrinum]|uniref:retinol-binding protein 3 n=1 Tax=Stegostoma tigrinum TaxID=3053191 RepID=UPI002870516E|nr:retinol-binding protein 3 [Stegostoma tigrinum]
MDGTASLCLVLILVSSMPSAKMLQSTMMLDMAEVLLENYCFPENLAGMKEAIRQANQSEEILHVSEPHTLAAVLTAGLQGALNDPRLRISYEPGTSVQEPAPVPPLSREMHLQLVQSSVKFEILDNNVGYLRIDHIIEEEMVKELGPILVERIWDHIVTTNALILDLRYSESGKISGVPFLISYFCQANDQIHIDSVYDRPSNSTQELWTLPSVLGERYRQDKDLLVLVSSHTQGVAEDVAYILKHLDRALLVGERTAGGSLNVQKFRIGTSDYFITVPLSRSISPITGQSWEVNGVFPVVLVSADRALEKATSILAIRKAVPNVIARVSNLLGNYYAFVDHVPALLRQISKLTPSAVISEQDLAAKLNCELQAICEDPRLTIRVSLVPPQSMVPNPSVDPAGDASSLLHLLDSLFQLDVLEGNIGYLRFDQFPGDALMPALSPHLGAKVWAPLRDTDAMIVDLRFNSGGPSASISLLLSHFQEPAPPVLFYTVYNRLSNTSQEFSTLPAPDGTLYSSEKDVYVLTSHRTASAAEEFAYLMQSLNRATVIGEITSGTLRHSSSFPIGETNLVITIPFLNFLDNNGEYWLGGGVVPDAIVLAEEALEKTKEVMTFHAKLFELVEETANLLKAHYAMPEVAAQVSSVLHAKRLEGWYRSVVDSESLASQLTSDLKEAAADHRLQVFCSASVPEPPEEAPESIPSPEELGSILRALFKVEVLPSNVGYLRFDLMAGADTIRAIGPQLLEQVWNKLVDTESLVIDMRYNVGGYSTAIPILCSYFFAPQPLRHLYTVFDRPSSTSSQIWTMPKVLGRRYSPEKDIYILTSHITGSAAETFTRAMMDLKRATVVGEPTIGGALSIGTYRITHSDLYMAIPNQVVLSSVSGQVWSVSGAEPHVPVQANEALQVALGIVQLRAKIPWIIRTAGELVAANYASAESGASVAEHLAHTLSLDQYSGINSELELAQKLSEHLQQLSGDKHLRVAHIPENRKDHIPGVVPIPIPPPEMFEDLIKFSFQIKVFDNTVGYLRFDMFSDLEHINRVSDLMVQHVWNKIANTTALIVDLRYNIGGPTSAIPALCSYFFDEGRPVLLDTVYNRPTDTTSELWTLAHVAGERYGSRRELILLTSNFTSGAAEEFVFVMKKLGRALVVGELTSGGCHPPQTYHVDDTQLYLSIPTVKSSNPDGESWEGTGVAPHLEVAAETALEKARDLLRSHLHRDS